MPNTITPTKTKLQVIHRVTFPAIYPTHNAQEYSRKAGDEPQAHIPIGNHASVQASPHAPVMRLRIAQFFLGGTLWGYS
jgi:hypothetical protein